MNAISEQPAKRHRPNVRSFVAETDVQRMLERATSKGVTLAWICNTGLRKFLTQQGYARKKEKNFAPANGVKPFKRENG